MSDNNDLLNLLLTPEAINEKKINDDKIYLNKTDYSVLKIAEEMSTIIIKLCEKVGLEENNYIELKNLLLKYNEVIIKRKDSRNEISVQEENN